VRANKYLIVSLVLAIVGFSGCAPMKPKKAIGLSFYHVVTLEQARMLPHNGKSIAIAESPFLDEPMITAAYGRRENGFVNLFFRLDSALVKDFYLNTKARPGGQIAVLYKGELITVKTIDKPIAGGLLELNNVNEKMGKRILTDLDKN